MMEIKIIPILTLTIAFIIFGLVAFGLFESSLLNLDNKVNFAISIMYGVILTIMSLASLFAIFKVSLE